MKRLGFIVLAFALACGIFYTISLLLKPKPIAKMNPTSFDRPEEIGAVIYRRLRQDVRKSPLVVFGSSPWVRDYEKIWSGFLLTAYSDQKRPKRLYQEPALRMPIAIKDMEVIELDWSEKIEENSNPREVHVVHTVHSQSSMAFDESFVKKRMGLDPKSQILTITMVPFAVNDDQLEKIQPSCPLDQVGVSGVDHLGCLIKRVSRKFFRKDLSPDKLWAVLEQHGSREYYLFVHQPQQSDYSGESF